MAAAHGFSHQMDKLSNLVRHRVAEAAPDSPATKPDPMQSIHCLTLRESAWTAETLNLHTLQRRTGPPANNRIFIVPVSSGKLTKDQEQKLVDTFGFPSRVWQPLRRELNGYFEVVHASQDGSGVSFETLSMFLIKQATKHDDYEWERILMYTRYFDSTRTSQAVAFATSPEVREILRSQLEDLSPSLFAHPFAFHAAFYETALLRFDKSVWSMRDNIRDTEILHENTVVGKVDFSSIHNVGRHVAHSTETLEIALISLTNATQRHQDYTYKSLEQKTRLQGIATDIEERLVAQVNLTKSLIARSKSLENRLKSEINRAFQSASQGNSSIALDIAMETRTDNRVMRTIAFLGLIFLPGTFISSFFSMDFFSFSAATDSSPASILVAPDIWVFFAITVPITVVLVVGWLVWRKWENERDEEELGGKASKFRKIRRKTTNLAV